MKHFNLGLLGLVFFSLIFVSSCKKDEAEPQFEKADLIGVWEQIGGTDFVACPDGNNALIEIAETEIELGGVNENGCNSGALSAEYEFKNGNTFDADLFQFKVTALNGDKMSAVLSSFGTSTNYELQKLQ